MERGPKQDEFDALIHQALMLMHTDQAVAVLLTASPSPVTEGGVDVNFAGNSEGSILLDAIGYQIGQASAHEPKVVSSVALGIKRGVEDVAKGEVVSQAVERNTSSTKH